MSDQNNFDSTNLSIISIPEDAFEQFQANSMYVEEEYITLSDIVPPEPVVPELPSDISEIPYDNEVVLDGNDDGPILNDLPSTVKTDQTDSVKTEVHESDFCIQQSVNPIPDLNILNRPRRARKRKSYVDDFIENDCDRSDNKIEKKKKTTKEISAKKTRRGRKPKQKLAQNEISQPEIADNANSAEQTPKPSKSRQNSATPESMPKTFKLETKETEIISPDLVSETSDFTKPTEFYQQTDCKISTTQDNELEMLDSVKSTSRRRGISKKKSFKKTTMNTSDSQLDTENNILDGLVSDSSVVGSTSKNTPLKRGRRGRPRKTPEKKEHQVLEQKEVTIDKTDVPQNPNENDMLHTNSIVTDQKKKVKHGKKKNVQEEVTTTEAHNEDIDDEDESDNISLKTLSMRNGDKALQSQDWEITNVQPENQLPSEADEIDVGDDMALSQLKETYDEENQVQANTEVQDMELDETVATISTADLNNVSDENNQNLTNDFEYKDETNHNKNDSLLQEVDSKRPNRRRARKIMHYDEGSDEDPFANVELSDDEPGGKKGRYYSDDEYVPGSEKKKGGRVRNRNSISSDDEDSDISEIEEDFDNIQKGKKKRSLSSKSGNQKMTDINVTTIAPKIDEHVDDFEVCLQSSVITTNDSINKKPTSVYTNEFENFLAKKIQGTNIKIKKVSSTQSSQSTQLDIPVLDPHANKTVETSVQTDITKTSSSGVQTNVQHEVVMKDNVSLTAEQSEKACEFLKSIVKTTSELGQLMTEKSEGFITKKINTSHVTDTFKMDYCVKKSFLLLKLAKHNIVQMEEDLAKQYEEFLKQTDLIKYREEEKTIKPTEKDNDSDCEIVEEPQSAVKKEKSKFNPKTVFLNKELSIKIAKKSVPQSIAEKCKKTLNIKDKKPMWISNNVMVKKVKPTQSFLAQDSRNKKPPDCFVTEKMVSDFFDTYYYKLAPSICAPFTTNEWLAIDRNYVCNYFFLKSDKNSYASTSSLQGEVHIDTNVEGTTNSNIDDSKLAAKLGKTANPMSLIFLCTEVLKNHLELNANDSTLKNNYQHIRVSDLNQQQSPNTLFQLCLNFISGVQKSSSVEKQKITESSKTLPDDEQTPYVKVNHPDAKKIKAFLDEVQTKELSEVEDTEALLDVEPVKELPQIIINGMLPLKTICYRKISELMEKSIYSQSNVMENVDTASEDSFTLSETSSYDFSLSSYKIDDMIEELDFVVTNKMKSLFSLCIEKIQKDQFKDLLDNRKKTLSVPQIFVHDTEETEKENPNSLKILTFNKILTIMYKTWDDNSDVCQHTNKIKNVKLTTQVEAPVHKVKKLADICFTLVLAYTTGNSDDYNKNEKTAGLTIDCVNTVSEEAFHNMEEDNLAEDVDSNFYGEENYNGEFNNFEDDNQEEDNNWESQVQLQEFKPIIVASKQTDENHINEEQSFVARSNSPVGEPVIAHVKLEPLDEPPDSIVESAFVKTEPMQHDEMTIIPESVVTKQELSGGADDDRERIPLQRQNSSSFDEDSFENFVRQNKMMQPLDGDDSNNEIFTQSGLRIRRQHEPDYMNEYDPSLNLLIPQTFEPLSVENAKGVLMASSSDDERSNHKTNSNKKKADKKARGRTKKTENKQQSKDLVNLKQIQESISSKQNKEVKVSPSPLFDEVAVLTRRMREKIRQEEKKVKSSDSEGENVPVTRKKEKERKETEKAKSLKTDLPKPIEEKADAIQCSNVDSTEQIEQNDSTEDDKSFTGFSVVDQNEINSYQKYVKFVYDKILPKHTENVEKSASQSDQTKDNINMSEDNVDSDSPLINYDEPAEMLECEPTMPIFDDSAPERRKRIKPKSKTIKVKEVPNIQENIAVVEGSVQESQSVNNNQEVYTERNGWHCYPINPNETKLYMSAGIILEKLPESFVETYFEYQEVAVRQNEDKEVDRLINLNTLSRSSIKETQKTKGKCKVTKDGHLGNTIDTSRAGSPTSDGCAELTASEDEGANVDDELPPPLALKHPNENSLAKNSLMDESDSDEALSKHKGEANQSEGSKLQSKKMTKRKQEMQIKSENPESLMLTADKMMNKELNLLHAPVVLSNEINEKEEKNPSPKNKFKRSSRGHSSRDHAKNDEDSSSEEEKQWVSTKEKLLKRMVKKQDTTSADDAKRAKLVSEFIERRGVGPEVRKRGRGRGRRRNSRKVLEREKQMMVLSHELFGTPADSALMGTRHAQFSQSYFKGRRNIRKVIDKKSLQRSTVIANMEEFERKCRLNQRQAQLRELLGCEDGVNVLVINDEVCLEYGFEDHRPLVTVHPFFTKVMKAHQYEGVKFMWDACFETLEKVESGHPGGGCILAHCMGLGKTLQVLALLHTVLTHPRVGMQRILVCCPLSTVLNWVDEIHKWIGPVTDQIKVFELSKLKKTYERAYQLEDWYSGGGIFIIGYELFRSLTTLDAELDDIRPTIVNKIRTALLDPGPDIIVCDEGHLLKNDCSVLAIAMSRVATKRRIVLTGTPMQNNLREYYCMVNFVKPNLLGTYSEYSNRFENPIMNGQHRDSREEDIKLMKQRTHILHKVLESCLQRQEASVLYPYLPKKHEYTVFISLTKVQWDLYKHYINNYSANSKQSILKDFHILQKIWSHPQVLHNFQTKKRDDEAKIKQEKLEDDLAHEDLTSEVIKSEDVKPAEMQGWWLPYLDAGNMLDSLESSNKFVVVFKILDECIALGDKVLIFSTSLFTMDALEYFLQKINKWSLGQEYYRLDGSVPAEVRQKWCREFNAEHNLKTKLFLISTRAGSLGLNMVAANRVIILDTSWNPAHDIQSIFRVYRFGQKKDCYIYRLVALGTMEQKIYERSVTKQAVSCRVVDEQQIDRHYNMAELTELYKYDDLGMSVAGGVAVGVEDVALLRVARLAALHAVHEHDSLLRGNSEQQLPEHERAAAWMQFQQEHAHKQMQNQLTSSFSLHLPSSSSIPNLQTYQQLVNDTGLQNPDIKQETPNLLVPYQPPSNQKTRPNMLKKKKKVMVNIPEQDPEPPMSKEAEAIQEKMAQKIMNILIRNNFQNRQKPREIADLVATVRKIVAYGYIPKDSFDNAAAQEIADVLLMKEHQIPAPQKVKEHQVNTPQQAESVSSKPKRGRPRKQILPEFSPKPSTPTPTEPPPQPSTSRSNEIRTYVRRKAAINAEKQIDSLKTSVLYEAGDNDMGDSNWQNDDSGPEEIVPESKPKKKTTTAGAAVPIKTENVETPEQNQNVSIVLSDDDEPMQTAPKQTKKKLVEEKVIEQKPALKEKQKKASSKEEEIPLHPSLLSNKNFIKIVAHTYLEGNPMLDEDAATLAAQYSTLRARRELEATGKPITNGPIYDIAVKVLGIDILKKLHKANPVSKMGSECKDAIETASQSTEVKAEPVETRRPGLRLKAKGIGELTGKGSSKAAANPPPVNPPPASPPPSEPAVVPVGFINRAGSMKSNVAPAAPPQQMAPPSEESILPDDDDVIISDHKPVIAAKSIFKKNAKPLILNSVLANTKSMFSSSSQPKIPKLVISAGKLRPATGFELKTPPAAVPTFATVGAPASVPRTSQDTICLDSDEETITPNEAPAPKPKKRVAVKSTAKPARAPALAPPAPVPVSISAANPQLNALIAQNDAMPNVRTNSPLHERRIYMNQEHMIQQVAVSQVPQPQLSGGVITLDGAANVPKYGMTPDGQVRALGHVPAGPHSLLRAAGPDLLPRPQTLLRGAGPELPPGPHTLLRAAGPELPHYTQTYTPLPPHAEPPPAPRPPMPPNKTICKPGDILRITKTGQIEVLNRKEEDVAIVPNDHVAPSTPMDDSRQSRLESMATRRRAAATAEAPPAPPPKPAQPPKAPEQPNTDKIYDRSRKVSVSSSSSSDSSRASSPDPLSILKDVVHIKAPDDDRPKASKPARKPSMIGSTTISKSTDKKNAQTKNYNMEPTKAPPSKPSTPAKTPTQDEIMKHISKTDTILKKLDKALGPGKQQGAAQKASIVTKPKPSTFTKPKPSTSMTVDTIDLDFYEAPVRKQTIPTKEAAGSKKYVTQTLVKAAQAKSGTREAPKKIVGTSKDIIISVTGQSKSLTAASNASKAVRVTSVPDKMVPSTAASKKRPAPVDAGPQKKKAAPMTLKDFNIDDIDDIIELE